MNIQCSFYPGLAWPRCEGGWGIRLDCVWFVRRETPKQPAVDTIRKSTRIKLGVAALGWGAWGGLGEV